MGVRSFLHRFYAKVKEIITGKRSKWRNFKCSAKFENGGSARFTGPPWGPDWEKFKELLEDDWEPPTQVFINMGGSWVFD